MTHYVYPEYYEHPALHDAVVMVTILKLAAQRCAGHQDFAGRIEEKMRQVDLAAGMSGEEETEELDIESRVIRACGSLTSAGLLTETDPGNYRITGRGRKVLDENPTGIDASTLAEFDEFVTSLKSTTTPAQLNETQFDAGFAAFHEGQSYTQNPFPPDRIEHLAWYNGWATARDTEDEHNASLH